jgi:hypothetical protein
VLLCKNVFHCLYVLLYMDEKSDLKFKTCQGNVPRVLWAAGYGPKSGYDRFPPVANDWATIHPVPGNDPTTLG